jgi:hypothetical protein
MNVLENNCEWYISTRWHTEGVGGGVGVFKPPPTPKLRSFDKAEPNSQFRGKYIRNNLIRIRGSLICKLIGTPDEGATAPRSPFCLPCVLNWICWTPPPPNKISGYATVSKYGEQPCVTWKIVFGKLVVAQLFNNLSSFVKPAACSHKYLALDSTLSWLSPHQSLPQQYFSDRLPACWQSHH